MKLHADFTQRVVLHGAQMPWIDSPAPGVQRRMLDRIGDEVARATSFVRYAPGSQFAPHTHGGGEEFIVLEGVFSDEHGDYPAGSYIRNPPTTRHSPRSAPGCVIFVKLWQFDPDDRTPVVIDMHKIGRVRDASRPGIDVTPLFEDARETVELLTLQPRARLEQALPDGAELLVLDGSLAESGDELAAMSWLRLPCGARVEATAGAQGARVWAKTRHLRFVDALSPTKQALR
jgi:quercetin dioxygenase-like cupin family protein